MSTRKEELQALMRDRSLTQDERAARIKEVKAKYAGDAPPPADTTLQIPPFRRAPEKKPPTASFGQKTPSVGNDLEIPAFRAKPAASSSAPKGRSSVKDRMAAFNNNSFVPNYDPVAFAVSKNKAHSFKTQQAAKRDALESNMKYNYNYGDGGVVDKTSADFKAMGDDAKAAKTAAKESASRYDYRYTG